jgi:hypothetical protein
MTAQASERIVFDGRPYSLNADPLSPLVAAHNLDLRDPDGHTSACWRGYVGTWEVLGGTLHLLHLNHLIMEVTPFSPEARKSLFQAVPCQDFPIPARWFSGRLRVATGRMLIYSHHGWSSWFETERVLTVVAGEVTRDRVVNTGAMLTRRLKNDDRLREILYPTREAAPDGLPAPLFWLNTNADSGAAADKDWWPPDFKWKPHGT